MEIQGYVPALRTAKGIQFCAFAGGFTKDFNAALCESQESDAWGIARNREKNFREVPCVFAVGGNGRLMK